MKISKYRLKELPLIEIFDAIRNGNVDFESFEYFFNGKIEENEYSKFVATKEEISELEKDLEEMSSDLEEMELNLAAKYNEGYDDGYKRGEIDGKSNSYDEAYSLGFLHGKLAK